MGKAYGFIYTNCHHNHRDRQNYWYHISGYDQREEKEVKNKKRITRRRKRRRIRREPRKMRRRRRKMKRKRRKRKGRCHRRRPPGK